jgi:fumarate reductase subunit C
MLHASCFILCPLQCDSRMSARIEQSSLQVNARVEVWRWAAQRVTAAIMALFVVVHLITMIYAVHHGLTASQILGRTHGSAGWATFYALFVALVAIHAPIGLRNVLAEHLNWRGVSLDVAVTLFGILIAILGWRAVWAVCA